MQIDHDHVQQIAHALKTNWHWLSASAVGLAVGVKWTAKQYMSGVKSRHHPTHEDLNNCRAEVMTVFQESLDEHEQVETAQMDEYRRDNREEHDRLRTKLDMGITGTNNKIDRLDTKIDALTHTIIENLRAKK